MPHDTEDFNFNFLPLWNLPRWEQAARDDEDEQALELDAEQGTDRDTESYRAWQMYIATLLSKAEEWAVDSGAGSIPADLFETSLQTTNAGTAVYGTNSAAYSQPQLVGDLGPKPSAVAAGNQRGEWWTALQAMNKLLDKAKNLGHDIFESAWEDGVIDSRIRPEPFPDDETTFASFMLGSRPATPTLAEHKRNGENTPDLFIFKNDDIAGHLRFIPYIIMLRFVALHHALFYGSGWLSAEQEAEQGRPGKMIVTRSNKNILAIDLGFAGPLIRTVDWGLRLLEEEILIQEELAIQREIDREIAAAAMEGANQAGFARDNLNPEELEFLARRSEYQKYFSTTFSKEIITFVPIMQNFFLTGKYFQNINESFYASNALALEILISTIRNDDNYKNKPDLRRLPPALAGTADDQLEKHSASARDFILKMLIMTPINILKGLCGLIDPHIGLTKIIKNVTGYAFDELAEVLNVPAEGINVAREEAQLAIAQITQPNIDPATIQVQGINGDDLLKFILCILQVLMEEAMTAAPRPDGFGPIPPNFFPDIKRDGINFTGKISGLLMMPPTPFGLIYLLLGLIKFGEDEVVDVLQPPEEEEVCLDPGEASVAEEVTEDLCEPDDVP